jgi:hypothetical protein
MKKKLKNVIINRRVNSKKHSVEIKWSEDLTPQIILFKSKSEGVKKWQKQKD